MLGKLMKYEWKATRRIFPLIYLVVLVFAVLSGLSMRGSFLRGAEDAVFSNERAMALFLAVYAILIVALVIVTIVVIIHRFYQSMLSQEGYLTHMLPVKKWQQIVSKLLMAFIWMVLAVIVIVISVAILFGMTGKFSIILQNLDWKELFQNIGMNTAEFILLIVLFVVGVVRSILQLYAAMAIGGSANAHKVAYSFLAYIVIAICTNIISVICGIGMLNNMSMTVYEYSSTLPTVSSLWVPSIILNLCISVVLFILTEYFLRKKLNLE